MDITPVDDGVKSEGSTCVVRDLAMALLQIEQMLDPKYLNPPLGMYISYILEYEIARDTITSLALRVTMEDCVCLLLLQPAC